MARRLYLGSKAHVSFISLVFFFLMQSPPGLSADARSEDVSKLFEGYGNIIDCRVMTGSSNKNGPPDDRLNKPATGFGFVEFENAKARLTASFFFGGR